MNLEAEIETADYADFHALAKEMALTQWVNPSPV
jgi:hypothetical protein